MITSRAIKESDRKDRVIRVLTIFCSALFGLVLHAHWLLATLPKEFECHFPPDLSRGGMVKVNEYQAHEVYAFALTLFQKIYRCEGNCGVEFSQNIRRYGYFLTDTYRPALLKQANQLSSHNRNRIRAISEYEGYDEAKVVPLGNDKWIVYLDVREKEYIGPKSVRDAVVRYPLVITRFDIDREKNPWRLAISGLHDKPTRLK